MKDCDERWSTTFASYMEHESSVTPPALDNKAQSTVMCGQYREHGLDVYDQDVALALRERSLEEAHESGDRYRR